jgi:hypothetical protein
MTNGMGFAIVLELFGIALVLFSGLVTIAQAIRELKGSPNDQKD